MKSRPVVAVLAVLGLLTAALVACTGKDAVDQTAGGEFRFTSANLKGKLIPEAKRKKAADFTGSLLEGGTYRLSRQAGKVVVVNFWGTWCGPCKIETPQFNTVYNAQKSHGVAFVGIDVKDATRSAPKSFVKDFGIDYPIVYDEGGATAVALGDIPTNGMPFTVLVDRQRRIAAVYIGPLKPADLEPPLATLAAEQ